MKRNFQRVIIGFSLLAAGLVLVYFFTLHFLGSNPLLDMKRLDILIILLCEVFALGYFRDRFNKGSLNFWEGALIGVLVAFGSTLLFSLFIYTFIKIQPEVLTDFIKEMQTVIQNDFKAGKIRNRNDFDNLMRNVPTITPFAEVFSIFITDFILCGLGTILVVFIMRRQRNV